MICCSPRCLGASLGAIFSACLTRDCFYATSHLYAFFNVYASEMFTQEFLETDSYSFLVIMTVLTGKQLIHTQFLHHQPLVTLGLFQVLDILVLIFTVKVHKIQIWNCLFCLVAYTRNKSQIRTSGDLSLPHLMDQSPLRCSLLVKDIFIMVVVWLRLSLMVKSNCNHFTNGYFCLMSPIMFNAEVELAGSNL